MPRWGQVSENQVYALVEALWFNQLPGLLFEHYKTGHLAFCFS